MRLCDFDILQNKHENNQKAVLVLHGFGASASDLAPIGQAFEDFKAYDWYFVDAPLEVPLGMGMVGKAWYPLDMEAIQLAISQGKFLDLYRNNTPEGLPEILDKLQPLMNELSSHYESLALGGFSQGSIVSSHLINKTLATFNKLFLFSSAFVDQKSLEEDYNSQRELSIFQSHGQADPILPFAGALELKEFLTNKQYQPSFHSFSGGHETPYPVLEKFKDFLGS